MNAEVLAKEVLRALLEKNDKNKSMSSVKVSTREKFMAPYLDDKPLGIFLATNELLSSYETEGLISLKYYPKTTHIHMIYLGNADLVANMIGYTVLTDRLDNSISLLDKTLAYNSIYDELKSEIKESWINSKTYLGCKVSDTAKLVDIINGVRAILEIEAANQEIDYRHFSVKIFKNSKRLDEIKNGIAKLLNRMKEEAYSDMAVEDILKVFGLFPIKHPVFLSGSIEFWTEEFSIRADFPPAIGVWPDRIDSVSGIGSKPTWITTIENQATFLKYIQMERSPAEIVLYTAGVPSPAFKRVYREIVKKFSDANLRHWGDIDLGGFTILSMVEKNAERPVEAFRMTPEHYVIDNGEMTKSELDRMLKIDLSDKNKNILFQCVAAGMKFEQESY